MEFSSKEENHNNADFLRVLGKAWHMIGLVPPLSNIIELNMDKYSWGSVVPSYSSNVLRRRKSLGKGIDMMNSKKGCLGVYKVVDYGGTGMACWC